MLQDLAERGAFDNLDNTAEHVGRHAILPHLARLMHERKRGQRLDIFGQRPVRIHDIRRLDQLLDRRRPGEAIGQPRCVPHEVLDGDRPLERRKIELVAVDDADLRVGEGGDVFRDRIGDEEPSLLDQHHRGDRNDRLGHRIDAEDRVVGHSRAAGPQSADHLPISDLAVAGDQHGDAWRLLLLDLARHDGGEPLEPSRNKAQRFGRGVGKGEGTHQPALGFEGRADNGRQAAGNRRRSRSRAPASPPLDSGSCARDNALHEPSRRPRLPSLSRRRRRSPNGCGRCRSPRFRARSI